MKTIITLLGIAMFAAGSVGACEDSLKINKRSDEYKFWQGFDIGVNGYLNSRYTIGTNVVFDLDGEAIQTPAGYQFFELDYARSRSFAWNFAQHNFHIYKNFINFVTGFGIEWNTYALRKNVTLIQDAPSFSAVQENYNFTKNKFRTIFVNAPLLIEFNMPSKDPENCLHVAAGMTFGYNLFQNRLKQEFSVNGDESKRKIKDDFNINPFRYSLSARVGYGDVSLFVNYALSEMFKDNRGPKVYPFSAGVGLSF
ncbi:MAG: hypothetical protein Fur0041_17670 [Bacteroidia bacterium]